MFTQNNFLDPEVAIREIETAKLITRMSIDIEILKSVLVEKGIIAQADLDDYNDCLMADPEMKRLSGVFESAKQQIREFQKDPIKALQEILKANPQDAGR
jgi:hypothetical protein